MRRLSHKLIGGLIESKINSYSQDIDFIAILAERQGFEPWKAVTPCWFSRPVHSTALPSLRQQLLGCADKCIHLARKTASIIYYLLKECCPVINLPSEPPQCGACCFFLGSAVFPAPCSPPLRKMRAEAPKMSFLIARCPPYRGVTRTKGA